MVDQGQEERLQGQFVKAFVVAVVVEREIVFLDKGKERCDLALRKEQIGRSLRRIARRLIVKLLAILP